MSDSGKWRVLIADDEPAARRGVRQLLAPYRDFIVVGESRDGRDTLAALESLAPDVLFLDIAMPEIDGFEVIRRSDKLPAIVFLTAYHQFAIRAFDAAAHDYLVKPVSESRFAATIKRLRERLVSPDRNASNHDTIVVPTGRGALVLSLDEIDWIEAADNYVRVWTGGRSHLLRESLGALEERTASHGFVRTHRQALVRLGAIRALLDGDDGETIAVLSSGARVRVSRRRRGVVASSLRVR